MTKKIISSFIAALMVFSIVPADVHAEEPILDEAVIEKTEVAVHHETQQNLPLQVNTQPLIQTRQLPDRPVPGGEDNIPENEPNKQILPNTYDISADEYFSHIGSDSIQADTHELADIK